MRLRPLPSTWASLSCLALLGLTAGGRASVSATAEGSRTLTHEVVFGSEVALWPGAVGAPGVALTDEPGDPRVPYRDVSLLLPPGRRVVAAAFAVRGEREASLLGKPLVGAAVNLPTGAPAVWDRLPVSGATYPPQWGELLGESLWNGYRVATLRLYPWRLARDATGGWGSARGIAAVTIELELAPVEMGVRRRRAAAEVEERARANLAAAIANPSALAAYALPAVAAASPREGAYAPTWAPSLLGDSVAYVIVTSEALAAEFQRLADYKTARGLPTVVRTIEEIGACLWLGADLPARIRAFLTEAYCDWGTRAVLLGGDTPIVPTRRVLNTLYPTGEGTDLPVDLYYGCLDGDWNADQDEQVGEAFISSSDPGDAVDLAAELAVGRAPVNTAAEAAVFVDKIIAYEQDAIGPQAGRALFLSEVLFPSAWSPGVVAQDDGAAYSQAIIDSVLALAAQPPTATRLYESAVLWAGSTTETRIATLDSLNSGRFGLVNHVGHGFFYNLSVGDGTLDLKDASSLHNRPNYFVLNSLNCSSSAFDYNCILERLVLNPNGGAVATVGSARASFPNTASAYQREFYRVLFQDGVSELGAAVAGCRLPFDGLTYADTPERWTHMTITLLGDPTLAVWTVVPGDLTLVAPDTLPLGAQNVVLQVYSGSQPVPGARICLQKPGETYAAVSADDMGEATLPIIVKSGGSVSLSVTSPNHRPLVRSLPVTRVAQPYLKVTAVVFKDDGTLGSHGNGDGVPNAGEVVAVVPTFTNSGYVGSTSAVTVAAAISTPGVSLLSTSTTVPALAAGASATGGSALLVSLDAALPDDSAFALDLTAVDGVRVYRDEIADKARAPELAASVLAWSDWPSGNGNGTLDANENVALSLSLLNAGTGLASGLTATVAAGAGLTVVDGTCAWPDIPPAGEVAPGDPVIVRAATPIAAARGTLIISDAYGHVWQQPFNLVLPSQPSITSATSPTGGEALLRWAANADADLFGYHVYRSSQPYSGFARITTLPVTGGCLFRDSGLAALVPYYYKVAAVDSSRLVSRLSLAATISTAPPEEIGFPITLPVESSSHPAVGDINGDGRLEIVLAADYVYVWDANGIELRDGDSDGLTLGPFNGVKSVWDPAGVALANLTTRPGLEIVASNRTSKQVFVYQGDGSVAPGWPRTMNEWNWATPAVGDLDGDGRLEVVANTVGGRLYVWRDDGSDFYDGDGNPATVGLFQVRTNEWYSFCSPALADLDQDGKLEIILGTRFSDTQNDVLMALRNDGTNLAGFPVNLGATGEMLCSPSVADLDGDGRLEITFVTENDRLYVIDHDGQAHAPFPIGFVSNNAAEGISTPSPALADLNSDGLPEIIAVSVSSTSSAAVHVLTIAGSELTGWPRSVLGNSESSPVVADITGDGLPDVLFGIGGGADGSPNSLYGFRHDGTTVPGFPLQLSGPIRPAPCVTDLNGDGGVEIVYGGWDLQMHAWNLPTAWAPEHAPWPMFKGNPLRTGLLGQAWVTPVPGDEPVGTPARLSLEANRPNPFNPRTRIVFVLPGSAAVPVRLTIYDLRGRRVARLVDGPLPPGRHEIDWLGRDERGASVASGVYLYRLEADGAVQQRRMALVR